MICGQRDPFGFTQLVYHPGSGTVAPSLRELLRRERLACGGLDVEAICGHFTGARRTDRTVLADFRAVPPGHVLSRSEQGLTVAAQPIEPLPGELDALLLASLEPLVRSGRRVALALSGGLDSALLLALLQELGARQVPAYVLATNMPHYDEREAAMATARRLGAEVVLVEVDAADFVHAVPEAMRHLEEPLYNLHPIAKLLLARAMRRDGMEVAISGDGADQVLSRDTSANYLPLCRALFDAAGVRLVPPFVDAKVVAHLLSLPVDEHKACLRTLGRRLGIAAELTEGAKRRRLAPALDVTQWLPAEGIRKLATALHLPEPTLATDAQRVQWATLHLLLDDLGVAI